MSETTEAAVAKPSAVRDIDWRSWSEHIARPRTAVLLGFLSCPPCHDYKAALSALPSEAVAGWDLAVCNLPPREGLKMVEEGVIREIPTLIVVGSAGRRGRVSGQRGDRTALGQDIARMLSTLG
ncbi:hypothetical protein BrevBR_15390 [Brevundimonas sp. BR2-1]|uniref:hypothetical protein n=1 Tax=Brevundimonas sp. BR2-1 TaxID=3031123 RepID=UPI0030AB8B00